MRAIHPAGVPAPSLPGLSRARIAARAAYALRGNDRGRLTVAAPALYPHMWSWDAAFIAIGLAQLSTGRALTELETLLAAQSGGPAWCRTSSSLRATTPTSRVPPDGRSGSSRRTRPRVWRPAG